MLQRVGLKTRRAAQAMSYRSGHHSTSDDSSRYRTTEEMHLWRARDPGARLRRWLTTAGWWDDARETELRKASRQEVRCRNEKRPARRRGPGGDPDGSAVGCFCVIGPSHVLT